LPEQILRDPFKFIETEPSQSTIPVCQEKVHKFNKKGTLYNIGL